MHEVVIHCDKHMGPEISAIVSLVLMKVPQSTYQSPAEMQELATKRRANHAKAEVCFLESKKYQQQSGGINYKESLQNKTKP